MIIFFFYNEIVLKIEQMGYDECVYRGSCMFSEECKSRCGRVEFPKGTIGLCMPDPYGDGYLCCCTSYDQI